MTPRNNRNIDNRKTDDMDKIQATATFPNIAPTNRAAFKDLVKKAIDIATAEPETLQYDWFSNVDETRWIVREAYANSDAVLAHMGNLGELIGQLAELGGGLEIEAFGNVSPQLLEAAAALQPVIYGFFQGK